MKDAWFPYASSTVPRYTSYPTAADFSPGTGADDALEAAEALEPAGLCRVAGNRITVPEEARIMLRTVAQCFDARTPALHARRHAKAV